MHYKFYLAVQKHEAQLSHMDCMILCYRNLVNYCTTDKLPQISF